MADAIRSGQYDPADDMAEARFRVDYRFGYAKPYGSSRPWERVAAYERRMRDAAKFNDWRNRP